MKKLANDENKRLLVSDEGFVVVNGKETVVEKNEVQSMIDIMQRCIHKLPVEEWRLISDLRKAISDLETVGGL